MLNKDDVLIAVGTYLASKGYEIKKYQFLINATYEGIFVDHKVDANFKGIRLSIDDLKK